MSSPGTRHQQILVEIAGQFWLALKGKPCRVLSAPMDVRLSDHDVVQPDVMVVCDPARIVRTHIDGPPDLVLEILSPGSAIHDRVRKLALYARAGVREYWLITPYPACVEVYRLDGASYRVAALFHREGVVECEAVPGLKLELGPVFDFPLDPGEEIPLIREGHPPYAAKGGVTPATAT